MRLVSRPGLLVRPVQVPEVTLLHPLSGEVLPEDDARALRAAMDAMNEPWKHWRRIRERLAELEEYELPSARRQTDVQRRIASCPRCGGKDAA